MATVDDVSASSTACETRGQTNGERLTQVSRELLGQSSVTHAGPFTICHLLTEHQRRCVLPNREDCR
jgi:hypothetical protein